MPRERVRTDTVYKFAELSDDAKQTALDKLRDLNVDHEWWEFLYDDAKECGRILGIDIDRIYFSGFWSQGDGACFEGSYRYVPGAAAAIKKHAPQDAELARIARDLQNAQRPAFYTATASVKHRGHYYHSLCTSIECDAEQGTLDHDALKDALRSFMDWIYRALEKEYEYLTSDAQVIESIEANEYEFTEDGTLA